MMRTAGMRSVLIDGSTRGRPEDWPWNVAIVDDGRSAVFTTGRPGDVMVVWRLSLDDGAIERVGALKGFRGCRLVAGAARALGVTGDGARRLACWDAGTGRVREQPIEVRGHVATCSSDGRFVALSQVEPGAWPLSEVHIVRVADGQCAATVAHALRVVFTGDGRFAAVFERDGAVHAIPLFEGGRREAILLDADPDGVLCAERDGSRVVYVSSQDKAVIIDLGTGRRTPLGDWRRRGYYTEPRVAADRRLLDVAAGRALRTISVAYATRHALRDLATGAERVLDGEATGGAALAPDGRSVLRLRHSCFELVDVEAGTSRVWHDGHDAPVTGLAWSRGGRRLATRSARGAVRVWDVTTRALVWTLEGADGKRGPLAFGADGRTLYAQSENALDAWDLTDGAPILHDRVRRVPAVAMAVSDDGRLLAVAAEPHMTRVYDITGPPRRVGVITGALREPYHVAFDGPSTVRCLCAERADGRTGSRDRWRASWFDFRGRRVKDVVLPGRGYVAVDDALQVLVAAGDGAVSRVDLGASLAERKLRTSLDSPAVLCAGAGLVVCEEGPADARSLLVLSLDDGAEVARVGIARLCQRATLAPGGSHLAVAYVDGGVEVFATTSK